MKPRACELCDAEAALCCPSDSAFLCWNCDSEVHGANFLVARHVRRTVCSKCRGFADSRISGVGCQSFQPICRSCSLVDDIDSVSSLSSASSACISTDHSCSAPSRKIDFDSHKMNTNVSSVCVLAFSGEELKIPVEFHSVVASKAAKECEAKWEKAKPLSPPDVRSKAEAVLVNWCRMLGLSVSRVVPVVSRAFGDRVDELTSLPLRVWLAASLWLSLRLSRDQSWSTWQSLKRVEAISGVPSGLICATGSKIARVLRKKKQRRNRQEEGWAESSD